MFAITQCTHLHGVKDKSEVEETENINKERVDGVSGLGKGKVPQILHNYWDLCHLTAMCGCRRLKPCPQLRLSDRQAAE